jgi:hypothetical protein
MENPWLSPYDPYLTDDDYLLYDFIDNEYYYTEPEEIQDIRLEFDSNTFFQFIFTYIKQVEKYDESQKCEEMFKQIDAGYKDLPEERVSELTNKYLNGSDKSNIAIFDNLYHALYFALNLTGRNLNDSSEIEQITLVYCSETEINWLVQSENKELWIFQDDKFKSYFFVHEEIDDSEDESD